MTLLVFFTTGTASAEGCGTDEQRQYEIVNRKPVIHPAYSGLVIPPNIAPLNFVVREDGSEYLVKIHSDSGRPIRINSNSPRILIPIKQWHKLLQKNKAGELRVDVALKTKNGIWKQYSRISNTIAAEPIDAYLIFRKIYPVHNTNTWMGISQRNLESFEEVRVFDNQYFKQGCVNCHTFLNNDSDKMLLAVRSLQYGSATIFAYGNAVSRIGAKFTYMAWHPSGKIVVYSINSVGQFFHLKADEIRDVIDFDSLLAYYSFEDQKVKTFEKLARKDRLETYPTWSPNGCYLYFCSSPKSWSSNTRQLVSNYRQGRYDLNRISYDLETDMWGEPETVVSAARTDKSSLLPRISPDGRWLLFCMCDYGPFPVYQPSSDLYLIDLVVAAETNRYNYQKLPVNSNKSESWHTWSSNSRWIVFSSKRDYGEFTRSYISYVDPSGNVSTPFLVPQRDPEFYDYCLYTYSLPELVVRPVRAKGEQLGRVIRSSKQIPVEMPITMATPGQGKTAAKHAWELRE